MSNQLPHKEMIDAYLTGRMSPEESEQFLQRMANDPALKEEFQMQKDLVHSLQNFRRQQLKARLNTIDVGSGYSFTSAAGFKLMAGAALLALLGTGTYFAYSQLEKEEPLPNIQPIELAEHKSQHTQAYTLPPKPEAPKREELPLAEEESKERTEAVNMPAEWDKKEAAPKAQREATDAPAGDTGRQLTQPGKPEVIKPDVLTYFEEKDAVPTSPKVEAPEDKLADIHSFESKNIEVNTRKDKRYPFHYSFYDNQLYIYGNFSQIPYEVLEVNTGLGTSYFLYHDKNYYELNPKQQKVTRLKELKNKKIIKELEITRAEKLTN